MTSTTCRTQCWSLAAVVGALAIVGEVVHGGEKKKEREGREIGWKSGSQ